MSLIEQQDKIDNYLLNRLPDVEKADFERQLSDNAELKQKVDIQRLVVDELRYRKEFNRIIQNKRVFPLKPRRTMIIAWSVAAIFIGAILINRTVINNRMDSLYTQMYSNPASDEYRGEPDQEEAEFLKAVKFLKTNQPAQAEQALLKLYRLSDDYPYYEAVRWYLGLTELKLHNKKEAKKYLNELVDSETFGQKVKIILKKL